ncbi:YjfB family protein [Alkalicoccobacillus murimartini]|uniref:Motility protein n=1 Tax=Alkalicoccobacillus murimartini TaxID=171685 RepID=A0ABT9YG69_9BACI|nr:YjfB family protein [Alkalicoccobacillus murimartini]MDQ0206857.1 hypothetical protein [Alkalicoccobacillus murimartini]
MNIALLSMAMSQANVGQQVSLSVMKQAKETSEQQGEDILKLMDSAQPLAKHPHAGQTMDVKY